MESSSEGSCGSQKDTDFGSEQAKKPLDNFH